MTRTPPTTVELALAAEVSRLGLTATCHQLERWRAKRWLASTDQWTDPATSTLRPDVVHRAAWLAALSRPGRSISWIGWTFWAIDDTEHTATLLRQALIRTIQLPLRQVGITLAQVPQGDSDIAFDARQDLAARLLRGRRAIGRDLDGLLRAHARTAGITLPDSRTVSNPFDAALVRTGARLLMGGTADVSPEELTDALRSVWTGPPEHLDRIAAAHLAADHAGTDLRTLSPLAHGLPGWIRARARRRTPVVRGGPRLHQSFLHAPETAPGTRRCRGTDCADGRCDVGPLGPRRRHRPRRPAGGGRDHSEHRAVPPRPRLGRRPPPLPEPHGPPAGRAHHAGTGQPCAVGRRTPAVPGRIMDAAAEARCVPSRGTKCRAELTEKSSWADRSLTYG